MILMEGYEILNLKRLRDNFNLSEYGIPCGFFDPLPEPS